MSWKREPARSTKADRKKAIGHAKQECWRAHCSSSGKLELGYTSVNSVLVYGSLLGLSQEDSEDAIRGYLFVGSDVSALSGKSFLPVVVDFTAIDYDSKESLVRRRHGGIRYVGDRRKDEIRKLNLRFSLSEFSLKSVAYSLRMYSGFRDEIAMISSRGLKPLTQSEFEKLKSALN